MKWLVPGNFQGDIRHYFVSWGRSKEKGTFQTTKISESPFIHDFGSKYYNAHLKFPLTLT